LLGGRTHKEKQKEIFICPDQLTAFYSSPSTHRGSHRLPIKRTLHPRPWGMAPLCLPLTPGRMMQPNTLMVDPAASRPFLFPHPSLKLIWAMSLGFSKPKSTIPLCLMSQAGSGSTLSSGSKPGSLTLGLLLACIVNPDSRQHFYPIGCMSSAGVISSLAGPSQLLSYNIVAPSPLLMSWENLAMQDSPLSNLHPE
jgi:hypothetical protein